MNNPERFLTLGTLDEDKQNKTQHRKLKKKSNTDPPKPEVNPGAREGYLVPVSYMLLKKGN